MLNTSFFSFSIHWWFKNATVCIIEIFLHCCIFYVSFLLLYFCCSFCIIVINYASLNTLDLVLFKGLWFLWTVKTRNWEHPNFCICHLSHIIRHLYRSMIQGVSTTFHGELLFNCKEVFSFLRVLPNLGHPDIWVIIILYQLLPLHWHIMVLLSFYLYWPASNLKQHFVQIKSKMVDYHQI